jgi:hypothetical protein
MNQEQKGNTVTMVIIIAVAIIIASSVVYIMATKIGGSEPVKKGTVKAPVQQHSPAPDSAAQSTVQNTPIAPADGGTGRKMISGKDDDACTGIAYDGNIAVKGWYVWDKGYIENEWMLEIADDDINKLPFPEALSKDPKRYANFNQKVKLVDAGPELQKELKAASKDRPKEVVLKGYYLHCEGAALVSIAPAAEAFKEYLKK